jgi:hypothetical protein
MAIDVLAVLTRERLTYTTHERELELIEARAAVAQLIETSRVNKDAVQQMVTLLENYRGTAGFDARLDAWISAYAFAGDKGEAALARVEAR